MSIHILPPDVAAKIAAGEVVERPANVVKELVENSLDAGATEIRVEIRDGGRRLLRVSDNGHGIAADEVELAFARHATSKLATADDLMRIATYGFRGEALYSIAAVSHVTLVTRHRDEDAGTQLVVEGGQVRARSRIGTPQGTILTVEHLFYNVPARQKFLRKDATEAGQIAAVVQRYALAFPACRLSLVSDGRQVFQSPGTGNLFDVLVQLHGLENARRLVPIGPSRQGSSTSGPGPDADVEFMALTAPPLSDAGDHAPVVRVTGYAGLPTWTRANRSHIDLFVNRRYVEDRTLTQAVVQAYHTLLPVGRYPVAVVMLEMDPADVDVNVHPQKTQVRFADERRLFAVVQKAVRRAIVSAAPIPDYDLPPSSPAGDTVQPGAWAGREDWAARRAAILHAGAEHHPVLPDAAAPISRQSALDLGPVAAPPPAEPAAPPVVWPASVSPAPPRQLDVTAQTAQLPPLRVVGQVGALYIIAEGPTGLYLIDQHAAHERILYEQFMAQRHAGDPGGVARQQLLEPLTLHVGHETTGLVAHHLDELQAVGFEVEPFGGDTFLVRSVPAILSGQDPLTTLEEIVASLARQRNQVGEETEARLVKLICKRAAIKAGQLLSPLEMQELVRQLEQCRSPRTCPHGRPTMLQLSAGELEKAFGRV